jgi:hypothetical protein
MVILGIILMIVGGIIFYAGEESNCLFMIIGAIINFAGIACIISAIA